LRRLASVNGYGAKKKEAARGACPPRRRHAASRAERTEQTRSRKHSCCSGPKTRTPELRL
jgi:hypothetical protein